MLYCSSECGSISIMQLRTIYCNTHVYKPPSLHFSQTPLALQEVSTLYLIFEAAFQKYIKNTISELIRSKCQNSEPPNQRNKSRAVAKTARHFFMQMQI